MLAAVRSVTTSNAETKSRTLRAMARSIVQVSSAVVMLGSVLVVVPSAGRHRRRGSTSPASVSGGQDERMDGPEDIIRSLITAYGRGDRDEVRRLLSDDLVAYVTNAEAGVDRVDGPDGYLARLPALDDAALRIDVTQTVRVAPDQALTMVRIVAERGDRTLHNVGAFLTRSRDGQLTEIWMVDAEPAYSDEFWS